MVGSYKTLSLILISHLILKSATFAEYVEIPIFSFESGPGLTCEEDFEAISSDWKNTAILCEKIIKQQRKSADPQETDHETSIVFDCVHLLHSAHYRLLKYQQKLKDRSDTSSQLLSVLAQGAAGGGIFSLVLLPIIIQNKLPTLNIAYAWGLGFFMSCISAHLKFRRCDPSLFKRIEIEAENLLKTIKEYEDNSQINTLNRRVFRKPDKDQC